MTVNGSKSNRKRKCVFRQTRIDKETRTSSSGRFYDYCKITNRKCDVRRCSFNAGGVRVGNKNESAD